jgi:hypothetical protein
MTRPPKPSDRTAQPRHKNKSKPPTVTTTLKALQHLTDEQPTHSHFQDFIRETNFEKNDRGAAILLATNVENALQTALLSRLKMQRTPALFGANSTLGPFSNKIQMAYAMDIFGDQTKHNLDIIRIVRNAFAHSKIPIRFDTPQVREACSYLVVPKLIPPAVLWGQKDNLEGRQLFQEACNAIAHNLSIFATWGDVKLPDVKDKIQIQLPSNFEILARRQALP